MSMELSFHVQVSESRPGLWSFPPTDKTHSLAQEVQRARGASASAAEERLASEGALNAARGLAESLGGKCSPPATGAGGPRLENPQLFSGPGAVDLIAFCKDAILVIEARGPGSAPGSATFDGRGRLVQGTSRYLRRMAAQMARSADPSRRVAGRVLAVALKTCEPQVRYMEARTGIDPEGGKAGPTVVREFGPRAG